MKAQSHVFLLRGIGPSTHRLMTMKALEAACHAAGLPQTRNLLATGNLVVRSDVDADAVASRFQRALDAGGLAVTFQRRTAAELQATVDAACRLAELVTALQDRPARVQIHFLPAPVTDAALDTLRSYASKDAVARAGAEVIIDYGDGISTSPLTLSRIDKALGRENTARNWNTIRKIIALFASGQD